MTVHVWPVDTQAVGLTNGGLMVWPSFLHHAGRAFLFMRAIRYKSEVHL